MTPQALYARAHGLMRAGHLDEATAVLRRLLAQWPGMGEGWNLLGVVCDLRRDARGAVEAYRRAIAAGVRGPVWVNLGQAQRKLGDRAGAAASFRQALAVDPGLGAAWHQLGLLLEEAGDVEGALQAYDQAARRAPQDPRPAGAALALRRAVADWSMPAAPWLQAYLAAPRVDSPPLLFLALPESDAARQRQAAARFAASQWGALLEAPPLHAAPIPASGRPIRVGYLSSDFREHAVAYLALEALCAHDRATCEATLYSHGPPAADRWRALARERAARFVDLSTLDDEQAARRIAADAPDVLVDLNGYTEHARTGILARRPAPVQATWLGYVGTLGHPRLADYLIADAVVAPPGQEAEFAEAPARLPRCFQPNGRAAPLAPAPPRTALGLPADAVVFCSFNQVFKLHPALWDAWCRILAAVPGSVLWLAAPRHRLGEAHLRRETAARGVDPARLVFAPMAPREAHLARLQAADLALDTWPYASGTTASDALRAGVPLLTRRTGSYAGRMAASLLTAAGLADCVHEDVDAYVEAAVALAGDPARRRALRARLRAGVQAAGLFEPARMAAELEALYRAMNRQAVAGRREPIDLRA